MNRGAHSPSASRVPYTGQFRRVLRLAYRECHRFTVIADQTTPLAPSQCFLSHYASLKYYNLLLDNCAKDSTSSAFICFAIICTRCLAFVVMA